MILYKKISKILVYIIRKKQVSHKSHVFEISFFFKEFCKQFNINLCIRSQRPKPNGICYKDPKIILAWRAHSLPIAITALIGQSGHLLMLNSDSCVIITKSDQRFLRRRFFKNFFMSL